MRRPIRCSPIRSNSIFRPSRRISPARAARRTASHSGDVKVEFAKALTEWQNIRDGAKSKNGAAVSTFETDGGGGTAIATRPEVDKLSDGAVVIAAITSCTNTSNPSVILGAGLVAKKAVELGLNRKPWVKTSLAPGSKVVTDYLAKSGLAPYLDRIGFNLVGYGCTTCIGNSGPLPDDVAAEVAEHDMIVAAVLSGNRNFEGRIHPQVRANYLASPPLVVAYALAGRMDIDLTTEPLGTGKDGKPVYLKDVWPTNAEVDAAIAESVSEAAFRSRYADVFAGDDNWRKLDVPTAERYAWDPKSEYVKKPPYFDGMPAQPVAPGDILNARALLVVGDSITTDHISPAGTIAKNSAASNYLISKGVDPADFNSYGARRGNHEVMMRGTFANTRIKNALVPGVEGSFTKYLPTGEQMSIFDATEKYKADKTPLMVLAGKEYGSGSSRDWAAKGPMLLGVRAVIAESFERIHRSNLIGMGILPLEYRPGQTRATIGLSGEETFDIIGLTETIKPRSTFTVRARNENGSINEFTAIVRIDTPDEAEYYRHGGILQYVLRSLATA